MLTLRVEAENGNYPIRIGRGAWAGLGDALRDMGASRAAIVTDDTVAALYAEAARDALGALPHALLAIPAGEASKSMARLEDVYAHLSAHRVRRSDVVIALGGGVVGDLAGFAAATWLRGVRVVQLPTTLLAQVDSSVGGKTAIDLPEGKNLVGAFHPPSLVCCDVDALATLPPRQLAAGMAEAIKTGLIADASLFEDIERCAGHVSADGLERIVAACCRTKAGYVQRDPLDRGVRFELNFGHTLGHALEAALGYEADALLHGEAVAIGMVAACRLGEARGVTPEGTAQRVRACLVAYGLPVSPPEGIDGAQVRRAVALDKKSDATGIRAVLLEDIGRARVASLPFADVEAWIGREMGAR